MSNGKKQSPGFWHRLKGLFGKPQKAPEPKAAPAPKMQLISDEYVPPEELQSRPGLARPDETIVGIDFGTSYSSVAVLRDRRLELVPIEPDGDPMMPSVVSFPAPGQVLIGKDARRLLAGAAQWTIVSPKRLLGRLYKDQSAQRIFAGLAFRTFAGSDRYLRFEAHGNIYSAQGICAQILKRLKDRASEHLGKPVTSAVLAAPVGFGSLQRSAIEQAARHAGLSIKTIISEPTAAVLACGVEKNWTGRIAIYDFGGGTFDFCVLEVSSASYTVVCSGGDPWLGGDDFDAQVANQLADAFAQDTAVDLRNRAVEWQALLFAVEQAKRDVVESGAGVVQLDGLINTGRGSRGLQSRITRAVFDQLTAPLIKRSMVVVERVLDQASLRPADVDVVLMTGGTSLLPAVQEAVTEYFGKQPMIHEPHLAVVRGTAVRAASMSGSALAKAALRGRGLQDVVGRTIGAEADGGPLETIFERDTPLPSKRVHRFFTNEDGQRQMVIRLFEQSTSRIDQSKPLGRLVLRGLRGAARGQEYVDVTFTVESNGVLAVNAVVGNRSFSEKIPTGRAGATIAAGNQR
jgi:molecular chaperone DnaK